jgi:glyoxylase-like metal-dependent hydrolase (beta-lactamase superfamily II)
MTPRLSDPIKVLVRQAGDVRLHTFISSFAEGHIANATHIVESKNQLVLVDAQFLAPYARQFRSYANSLKNKPIARLYLTHRHPDHWFGIGTAFSDVPIYALPETRAFLHDHGEDSRRDHLSKLGEELAPQRIVVPQETATLGSDTIDGVQYVFSKLIDTEIDFHLIIELPDLKTLIVQDLVYSGTHLYLTKDLDHWMQILGDMLLSDHDLFLTGHGWPADKIEVAKNVEYLSAARGAIDRGLKGNAFRDFMLQRYADRKCGEIFNTYLPRLFEGARDY